MLDFVVYDISDFDGDLESFDGSNVDQYEWVENGLSGGEVRQSILDRLKTDVSQKEIVYINETLELLGLEFSVADDDIDDEIGQESVMKELDNILYELEDEQLSGSLWAFSGELIYVVGE